GVLKRIHGTPLPGNAYLAGVLGNAATNALVQIGLVVLASKIFFGLGWPKDWAELAIFTVLGVACFASLGVAFSHVIPNFDAVAASAAGSSPSRLTGTFARSPALHSSRSIPKTLTSR